ncbi:MAG TPA: DUF5309 family protein [Candidatus Gracilibacteria bacterium]|nr:DUF5309 family protein [Candidatus Gracilibacteria bacterium]
MRNGLSQPFGTNNKYEWLESQLTPQAWTINGAINSGTLDPSTPANLVFDSTAGLKADNIIRFTGETTLSPVGNLQVRIVSVTNGTTATGVIYGGTTDITIPDNANAKLVSSLVEENKSSFTAENTWEPVKEYNYFQIFDQTISLSDTAMNSLMYGNPNDVMAQMKQALYKFEQKLAEQMVYGRRIERSGSNKGSFAGLEFFLGQSGGNSYDASGTELTPIYINNMIEEIKKDGGNVNTILCNFNQARKISAFNKAGNNPMITRDDQTAGSFVMKFVADLPIAGGLTSNIIVDEKLPNNAIYLLDLDKLALVPFTNRQIKMVDASANGQDGTTQVLRGEYTLKVDSAKYSAGLIKNLAV